VGFTCQKVGLSHDPDRHGLWQKRSPDGGPRTNYTSVACARAHRRVRNGKHVTFVFGSLETLPTTAVRVVVSANCSFFSNISLVFEHNNPHRRQQGSTYFASSARQATATSPLPKIKIRGAAAPLFQRLERVILQRMFLHRSTRLWLCVAQRVSWHFKCADTHLGIVCIAQSRLAIQPKVYNCA
jgi:hypothetical protein